MWHCRQGMVFPRMATLARICCIRSRSLAVLTSTSKIPAIDFTNPNKSRDKLAGQIVDALENVGFLYLDNVAGFDTNGIAIKKATEWFYNLPSSTKYSLACKSFNPENSNCYRGYFPTNPQNSSYKEGFEVGDELTGEELSCFEFPLYEPNQWPSGGKEARWFRDAVCNYYKLMHNTSLELCSLIARGFGAQEDWFVDMFSPCPLSTLRLINYPLRPKPIPVEAMDGDHILHCGSHSDSPILTMLSTFEHDGLQIEDSDGTWLDVPVRRNSLVVNIGDLLSEVTSYKLKATKHRVVDLGRERQSVAFFFEPCFDANIHKMIAGRGFSNETPLGYGFWLLQNIKDNDYIEYKELVKKVK